MGGQLPPAHSGPVPSSPVVVKHVERHGFEDQDLINFKAVYCFIKDILKRDGPWRSHLMPVPRFRHCRSGFITHRPEKRQTVSQGRHEASFELMSPLKRSQGLWGPHSGCAPPAELELGTPRRHPGQSALRCPARSGPGFAFRSSGQFISAWSRPHVCPVPPPPLCPSPAGSHLH